MKVTAAFKREKKTSDKMNLRYIGPGRDSKPNFEFASLSEEARYGNLNLLAKCIDASDYPTVIVESAGEQFELEMKFQRNFGVFIEEGNSYQIKREGSNYVEVDVEKQYEYFKSHHNVGDIVEGQIIDYREMMNRVPPQKLYFVNVDGWKCRCFTRSELEKDSIHSFAIYQYDDEKKQIKLSYNFRYDR